jgi:hypothetical protein
MSGFNISIGLDPVSMAQAQLLNQWTTGFRPTFESFLTQAGLDSLKALHQSAEYYAWTTFQNPQGTFEDSLAEAMDSPYVGWMGADVPYGRRLNYGFSGMTDSLGRYFEEWPIGTYSGGYLWAEHSIEDMTPEIAGYYARAFYQSLAAMGVH